MDISGNNSVKSFIEKPKGDGAWINAGFFVFQPEIFNFIEGDATVFEREPLETLAIKGELFSYKHSGFWKPMGHTKRKI